MTRERVRARQAAQPVIPVDIIRVTVVTVDPLTVQLPGGAVLPGIAVAGVTYTPGAAAHALYQQPAVWSVFPHA